MIFRVCEISSSVRPIASAATTRATYPPPGAFASTTCSHRAFVFVAPP